MGQLQLKKTEVDMFAEEFPRMIDQWLKSKKHHTLNLLVQMTKLRRQTIYDLASGKRSILNLHPTKTALIIATLEGVEIHEANRKYAYVLGKIEPKCNDHELKMDQDLTNNRQFTETFTRVMKNPVAVAIYSYSLGESGVLSSFIKDQFGQYGLTVLKELVDNRILVAGDQRAHYPINTQFLQLSREQVKEIIPALNTYYDVNHAHDSRNYNYFRIDKVNREALTKIQLCYVELDAKVTEILAEESSKGEIPFYCFGQMDTFIDKI